MTDDSANVNIENIVLILVSVFTLSFYVDTLDDI